MSNEQHSQDESRADALKYQALRWLSRLEGRRIVRRAADFGLSQREIARIVGGTEEQVQLTLNGMQGDILEPSPKEIIFRALVDGTSRGELVETLGGIKYTFGEMAPDGRDGRTSGTWDQVKYAYFSGYLEKDEYYLVKKSITA